MKELKMETLELMSVTEQENKEIESWKNSKTEGLDDFTIENIVNKIMAIKFFFQAVSKHNNLFQKADSILELGGGQGWASCVLKKKYNTKRIVTSDITEYATGSKRYWENVFGASIESTVCRSYKIPFHDESFDIVFCYSAAHHFKEYEKSMKEIFRVLKPGGYCLFFAEPSCKKAMYKFAYKRAVAQNPYLSEDVLIFPKILKLAELAGFKERKIFFSPKIAGRNIIEILYHYSLGKINFLTKVLGIPCDADYLFEK
jgi:ubiquinone/menaquinone biosynthesis C-methylase UbiE